MICNLVLAAVQISLLSFEGLTTLFVGIVLPAIIVSLVSIVPAVIELKRPRDAGPRLVAGSRIDALHSFGLLDVEAQFVVKPMPKLSTVFPVLVANLEAFT